MTRDEIRTALAETRRTLDLAAVSLDGLPDDALEGLDLRDLPAAAVDAVTRLEEALRARRLDPRGDA